MIISDSQKERLYRFLPENAAKLIQGGDVNEVLLALDMRYLDYLDEECEPTDYGAAIEALRDEIHWDNTH